MYVACGCPFAEIVVEPISLVRPDIILFDCSVEESDPNNVRALQDAKVIHKALAVLPPNTDNERKFIVLKNDKKVYLVFGPEFSDEGRDNPMFYTHSKLRNLALHVLDKDGSHRYQIKGGGLVAFVREPTLKNDWMARFGGSSRDHGVYDSTILPYSKVITDWFGLPTVFEWKDVRRPSSRI